MAEDQKETFGEKVDNYADQYEAALKENAAAFKAIAVECVAKGIKTAEEVVQDAKKAGIAIKTQTLAEMKKAENFAKQKYSDAKEKVTEVKGKVVTKAGEIKQGVTTKAEQVRDGVVETAGKVRDGAKDAAETAAIYGMMAGDKVVGAAGKVRDGVKDAAETVAIYGLEAKDRVVDAAETAAIYGLEAKDRVVETAGKVKDGVIEGAAMTAGAVVMTGRLGKKAVIKGAKTVKTKGDKAYTAAKGTAKRGLEAVGKWFQARGKNIRDAKDAVVTRAGEIREDVVTRAGEIRDDVVTKAGEIKQGVTTKAEQVRDGVVTKAGEIREGVTTKAEQVRDGVVETAGKVRDGVVDGAAKVAAVPVTAKNITQEAIQTASSRVQSRANTSIINMAKSGRSFMTQLFDRLETSAVSREERNQEAIKAREAAKAKDQKEEDQTK